MVATLTGIYDFLYDTTRETLFSTGKTLFCLGTQLSLSLMYISLLSRLIRRIIRWRAPELALVRALADAFEMVAEGRPGSGEAFPCGAELPGTLTPPRIPQKVR